MNQAPSISTEAVFAWISIEYVHTRYIEVCMLTENDFGSLSAGDNLFFVILAIEGVCVLREEACGFTLKIVDLSLSRPKVLTGPIEVRIILFQSMSKCFLSL